MADQLGVDAAMASIAAYDVSATNPDLPPASIAATTLMIHEPPSEAAKEEHTLTNTKGTPMSATKDSEPDALDDARHATKSTSSPLTLEDLPNELLSYILGFLDTPPLSTDLHDEPTFDLTNAEIADLKAASCVSKRWRETILPSLFRHSRLLIEDLQLQSSIPEFHKQSQAFMDFAEKHALLKTTTTFVVAVKDTITTWDNLTMLKQDIFASFWRSLFEVIDPFDLVIIAHPFVLGAFTACGVFAGDAWSFDCPCHYLRLRRPSAFSNLSAVKDGSVTPVKDPSTNEALKQPAIDIRNPMDNISGNLPKHGASSTAFTLDLAGSQDPTTNTPDRSNAESEEPRDARLKASDLELDSEQTLPQSSTLFGIRPWSSILLNEGSFIKAYSTYEFWLRRAPSVCNFEYSTTHGC